MLGVFLIVFREGLEAALIAAIILAYLRRTGSHSLTRYVWYGLSAGITSSIAIGLASWFYYGRIPESAQTLFEGVAALVAVAVLISMILWMATRGREIRAEVERRVGLMASQGRVLGYALFNLGMRVRDELFQQYRRGYSG